MSVLRPVGELARFSFALRVLDSRPMHWSRGRRERFDGESVVIEQLQSDGSYTLASSSRFLPLTPEDILRWLVDEDYGDELTWERRLDTWANRLRGKKPNGR